MLPRVAMVLVALCLAAGSAGAQEQRFFQLGSGPTGEIRFTLGGLVANALSNPPGSRPCEKGGSCGVPGLVAVARATPGSVANVDAIRDGRLDAALVQADIAYWAYHGTGLYKSRGRVDALRAVAMLYPETVHLVVRRDAGIRGVADLKGRRVSLGPKGSGTALHGRQVLAAWGVAEREVRLRPLDGPTAAEALKRGEIDAFLTIEADPAPTLVQLARDIPIALLPLAGSESERLRARQPFLAEATIPPLTYSGLGEPVPTLAIGIAVMTGAGQPAELIQGVTQALWHPSTLRLLAQGRPRAAIAPDLWSLQRLGIPLHPGAVAYHLQSGPMMESR